MGIMGKAKGMAAGLVGFLRETAAAGTADVVVKKTFEGLGEAVKERIQKSGDEQRGELRGLIHRLGIKGRMPKGNIIRRLNLRGAKAPRTYGDCTPYLPGDENHAMDALARFKAANDDPEELPVLEAFMIYLENLGDGDIAEGDRKFDAEIELLRHDPLEQMVKRIGTLIKRYTLDKLPDHAKRDEMAHDLQKFRKRIARKGWE